MKKPGMLGRLAIWSVLTALVTVGVQTLLSTALYAAYGVRGVLFGTALPAALAVLFGCWRMQVSLCAPLDLLARLLQEGAAQMEPALLKRQDAVGDMARSAARLAADEAARLADMRADAAQAADAAARRDMAEEICQSALPQVLPDLPSRAHFEVDGLAVRGASERCAFYDYFYLDPGMLCLVIGQTPGGGVAEALYMVVAQTTIRSRLRQGRSLEETMADVNAQLYDLGRQQCLNALVGTLSTADGRFTYINAGQQQPLLMRNEDRYEWLDAPIYAPLGRNQNVSYRAITLRFKQGDRIFLHTAGLAGSPDSGTPYGAEQLRADLNLTRSHAPEGVQLLAAVRDAAGRAYGSPPDCAMLTLRYCKGDKDLAHCDVPAQPEYAPQVAAFLKKQFADNAIAPRHYAKEAVLVDEVFALCCRCAAPGSSIMVECGVAPDAQMVNIRVTAVLGGVDPLAPQDSASAENAVRFIQDSADYVTFQAGEERDTITMVCFLE